MTAEVFDFMSDFVVQYREPFTFRRTLKVTAPDRRIIRSSEVVREGSPVILQRIRDAFAVTQGSDEDWCVGIRMRMSTVTLF